MTDEDKEQRAFEGEWFALADLLYGRKLREGEPLDEKRMEVSKRAFLMAKAPRLLEACEFALATLQGMSTEEFAAGGDGAARDKLYQAMNDRMWGSLQGNRDRTEEARRGIVESIRRNRARAL